MIRSIVFRAVPSVVIIGLAFGLTQTAQAQCQNGMCQSAVQNGSAVVTSTNAVPVNNNATVNAKPSIVGQPIYYESVNSCGYVTYSTVPPSNGCWSNGCANSNAVYSNPPSSPVQYPTHFPTTSRCPGGTCNVR